MKLLKRLVECVPYPIGHKMALLPFSKRLGPVYTLAKKECVTADETWGGAERERYVIEHFRKVFEHAREKFQCYRELYERAGVLNLKIETIDDIKKVPQIDKKWTREHFSEFRGKYRLNTGGSSGEPTAFWMDKECWAREWAHMHTIWEKLGYKYTDLKLAIRGKNLGKRPFSYNPVHNEYIINTYLAVKDYAHDLKRLFWKRKPKWFHGYPSSIYQFILECESAYGEEGTRQLFKGVVGLLLSSEYPHPYIVQKFESYGLKWISWYGHSEMAVLAWADEQMVCHPFVTYGLAEVVDGHLLGTSYHNFDMPLIRYDTGDLVREVEGRGWISHREHKEHREERGRVVAKGEIGGGQRGVCNSFVITEGRSGDFVEDRNGKKIPLTALIFGRHHKAFDIADHVQIRQQEPGRATLVVSGDKSTLTGISMADLFDLTNVAIVFDMQIVDKPIRTAAGKLKLKV